MSDQPPPDSSFIILIVVAVVLLLLSMCFSASESAFLSVNKLRIRFLKQKKDKKAIRIGKLLEKKDQLINTILIGNSLVNIALSSIVTTICVSTFGSSGVAVATFAATILLLIFGEITPKSFGTNYPEFTASALSGFIMFCKKLFHPFVIMFTAGVSLVSRIAGIKTGEQKVTFSEEDIKTLMEVSEEEGVIDSDEKIMMHKVFKFTDLDAKDIMRPRKEMTVIPVTAKYRDVIEISQKTHRSRFPVFEDDIDNILGILYIKDVLLYADCPNEFSLKKVMRPALFIPETKRMSSIQQILREKNQSIAIVLDEYSGTAGLLTVDDISRVIFGKMSDEYDIVERPEISKILADHYILSGSTRLADLSEKLGVQLVSDNSETLNGWFSEKLDRIPDEGDSLEEAGWNFTVISADSTHVVEVRMQKIEEEEEK
ncbi:MAG: hemolysin family protein [Treponemataceae bacterium]|nr:hemolysin family protein [Treponemataceae bacterium]